ncbi:unnamed protein product [Hydatigera taeniaeformis]|uniref:CxC5 domain-containing protein n=1 Tax=Hydatigena taeniaeformis TaxID=6205 RepID=A0A0R3X4D0_HYDTA|nr:unnamed protein product [Hydatigera taeniaeformis]
MQNIPHDSSVQHIADAFHTENIHYIDLENLPPDTPTVKLGSDYCCDENGAITLPNFIVAPMMALSMRCKPCSTYEGDIFIDRLDLNLRTGPTLENPKCKVCSLVKWLLTERDPYESTVVALYPEDPLILFEVMREIWSRFTTKVLPFSEQHVKYSTRISYLSLPVGYFYKSPLNIDEPAELMEWPALMDASAEWTNGFMYFLRKDIGERGILSHVACFIFCNLIRIMRHHISKILRPEVKELQPQFHILYAINDRPFLVHQLVAKMAKAIFLLLTEFDPNWIRSYHVVDMSRPKEKSFWYRFCLSIMVENIFAMNMTKAFYDGMQAEQLYLHYSVCETNPSECPCRFARYLESSS